MGFITSAFAETATDELNQALEGLTNAEAAGVGAVVGATFGVLVAITIVWYVFQAIADWKIFTKAGEAGWKSLIPIYNYYVEYDICWSGIYGLVYVVAIGAINMMNNGSQNPPIWQSILLLAVSVVAIVMHFKESMKLAKAFGKGTGFGVCLFLFGPICRLILGFGDAKYIGRP